MGANHKRWPYEDGFRAGCQSVEGNTYDSCELTIEGHERYCPDNPDDPACREAILAINNHILQSELAVRSLIILAVLKS